MTKHVNETKCRRALLQAGLAAAAGLVSIPMARAADIRSPETTALQKFAQEKLAQNLVQYQTSPKDGAKCSLCVNWIDPNACKIVAGTIDPNGWCVAFAPKNG